MFGRKIVRNLFSLRRSRDIEIYQEITEDKFADNDTDDRIYIDMRRSKGYTDKLEKLNRDDSDLVVTIGLKEATAKTLRPRITGYSQAEYWYFLSKKVFLTLQYWYFLSYNISKADEA